MYNNLFGEETTYYSILQIVNDIAVMILSLWYEVKNNMKEKADFILFWIRNRTRMKFVRVKYRLFKIPDNHKRAHIGKKELIDCDLAHERIADAIRAGFPMMVCRFGNNELQMMIASLEHRMFPWIDHRQRRLDAMCGAAGFFPNQIEEGEKFVDLMLHSLKEVDILAWWNIFMQDWIISKYMPHADICLWGVQIPWTELLKTVFPWSKALKGKKVLVVSPFDKSIREQYDNHRTEIFRKIYDADDILPEFQLITLRALQTMGGENTYGYKTWFDAFQYMVDECKKIDFDVAIIGCGAYGFPLAAEIKRMGKIAIHMGGQTQLMFGILGARWMQLSDFMERVVNESWVRPKEEETPKNYKKYENGCYW